MTNKNVWGQIMDLKKNDHRHKGVVNTLCDDEIETIIATVDFFGGNTRQPYFDLKIARYRVFDWLAMAVQGRMETLPSKVLAYSFLKSEGDVDKFIQDLRETDYEVDKEYEKLEVNHEE